MTILSQPIWSDPTRPIDSSSILFWFQNGGAIAEFNIQNFMTEGPGRYATLDRVPLVAAFYAEGADNILQRYQAVRYIRRLPDGSHQQRVEVNVSTTIVSFDGVIQPGLITETDYVDAIGSAAALQRERGCRTSDDTFLHNRGRTAADSGGAN